MQKLSGTGDRCWVSPAGHVPRGEEPLTHGHPAEQRGKRHMVMYAWWKGIFDRLLALLITAALSPLLILIAMGIRLDSPGSPLFCQERVGKDGRKFTAYKFRTMQVNNNDSEYRAYIRKYILENAPYRLDQQGQGVYKVVDDPRVTKFGALLRKTNMDELPQLFNVIKGEMSFVGPRPDIPFAVEMYKDWHRKRLCATPGITGLWQVYGRKSLPFDDMVHLDINYVERQSPLLDTKILLLTIRTVLTRDGS